MNILVTVLLLTTALSAGVLIAVAPAMGLVLAGVCAGGVAWTSFSRSWSLGTLTLGFTILGLFSGLVNPAFITPDLQARLAGLKWLSLVLPVVLAIAFSAHARALVVRPVSWCARLFLLFLAWSGLVLIARVGLDSELLFKWTSVLLIYLYAFGVIPGLLTEPAEPRPVLRALALVAAVIGGLSLLALLVAPGDALSMGRLQGIAFNPLTLAMFATLGVLTFATLGFEATGGLRSAVYFAVATLCAGLLVLTGGRASAIALFVGLCVLAVGVYRDRRTRVGVAIPASVAIVTITLIVAMPFFGVGLDSGLLREKGGEGNRLEYIRNAEQVLANDALTVAIGTGFGVVRKTYYARLGIAEDAPVTTAYRDVFWKLLHNSYLEVLIETGLVGLALLLAAMVAGLMRMRHLIRSLQGSARILGYGCLAIAVVAAIESAFNSVLLAPGGALGIWFWSLIGVFTSWDVARSD